MKDDGMDALIREHFLDCNGRVNMQGFIQAIKSYQQTVLRHSLLSTTSAVKSKLLQLGSLTSFPSVDDHGSGVRTEAAATSAVQHKGLENMTVSEVLMTKGGEKVGSWLWCRMDDTVYDAVKQVCSLNTEDHYIH